MKLDLDYKGDVKASVAINKESDNGSTNLIGSANPSSVGLSGSSSVGSGSSSGEDFSLLKRQKHELELKLKEEVRTLFKAVVSNHFLLTYPLLCQQSKDLCNHKELNILLFHQSECQIMNRKIFRSTL